MAKGRYEYVQYKGRAHLVCVVCRIPLVKGHKPRAMLPELGDPNPDPEKVKQAICGPDYAAFDMKVYGKTFGKLFDGRVKDRDGPDGFAAPIPKGAKLSDEPPPLTDYDIFEQARIAAQASGGGESVAQAFARLSELEGHVPETEISGPVRPPDMHTDLSANLVGTGADRSHDTAEGDGPEERG